jgi:hypothetical protein
MLRQREDESTEQRSKETIWRYSVTLSVTHRTIFDPMFLYPFFSQINTALVYLLIVLFQTTNILGVTLHFQQAIADSSGRRL